MAASRTISSSTSSFINRAPINKQLVVNLLTTRGPIPNYMAQSHASYTLETKLYKHEMIKEDNESMNETSFKEGLKEYLVSLLALRIQGEDKLEESYSIDKIGSTLLEMSMLGQITDTQRNGITSIIQGSNEAILGVDSIKSVLEKVQNVLNSENPIEQMVLEWIKNVMCPLVKTQKLFF